MPKKILIIEDEEILLNILKKKLIDEKYEVLTALDGEEGLQIMKEKKPDLILLDIKLPGMDGMELLDYVEDHFPDLIAVLITGNDNIKHSKASLVVVKPFNCGEMLAKVAALAVK